jgi:hypothetical protein
MNWYERVFENGNKPGLGNGRKHIWHQMMITREGMGYKEYRSLIGDDGYLMNAIACLLSRKL